MFRQLFERSADAIFLFDPAREVFVDCNRAAVEMMGATSKKQLLMIHPEHLSSEFQPDGQRSREKTREVIDLALSTGSHRVEWCARRMDGTEFPVEVLLTPIQTGEHPLMATVCRDITKRKAAEAALRESEARFRSLFERSADAMRLFDPELGRFIESNQAAVRQAGAPVETLGHPSPAEISPERQPNGRRSMETIAEYVKQALKLGTLRFDWMSRRYDGSELPVEVVLTAMPSGNRTLLFAVSRDISDRKRAEQKILELNASLEQRVAQRTAALRESEEKFRALFEESSQGIILHDESQMLEVNPAAVRIMGCEGPQELVGKHPADISPPFQPNGESSAVLARKYIQQCMANGSARFDWVSKTPQGKEISLEVTLTRIEWSGRQIIQALVNDITERKRAEAELRASEARLRESEARFSAAFRASPVSIVIFRMDDSRCVLANESFLKWVGYRLDEVLGRNSLELGIWEDPVERASLWQELRRTKSIHERECRLTNRHGQSFIMLISAEVIEINGEPQALTVGVDITERKRAQAALAESEARFSVAFQASPVFISIFRTNNEQYVLANDALLNWLGYARNEVLGRTSGELGMWENLAERDAIWHDLRTTGSIRQRECRWRNRSGELATVLLSAETITLDNEPHVLSLVLDITQRKNAEVEMLKALTREKELNQLKSNFVSMVSHEFRTPLGIIQSSTELLRDFQSKMQPDERDEQLQSIVRNTRRMAGMMEEVLVLSRLDAGKLIFQPATLDLNAFFRRVVDEVLSATSRRCPIELSLKSVPPEGQADERLLGHIFTNLLSNAIKYSEAGATVHLTVERQKGKMVCIVRDWGIGISEEDQQQLFSAFHRGGNVGTRPGTGLGLLLVKRCADLHAGKVQIQSTIGEGTTVTVSLPVFRNKA